MYIFASMKERQHKEIRQLNPTPVQETYRAGEPMPLLELLMEKSDRNRTAAKKILSSGRVSVQGDPTTQATLEVTPGMLVTVHRGAPPLPFTHHQVEVAWENADYVIAYKKSGLPTVNTSHKSRTETALWILSQHYKKTDPTAKLFMINRLDRNTAGFVMFAKSIDAKEAMVNQWSRLVRSQVFVACVEGTLEEKEQVLSATSAEDKHGKTRLISAQVKVDKSSSLGGMHVVQADVSGARIFSLRKLFGDNNLSIVGDIRSRSSFVTDKKIALEQIAIELVLPGKDGKKVSLKRPYPTHYFTLLKEDKGLRSSDITRKEDNRNPNNRNRQ